MSKRVTIEDLYGFALPEQPAVSPDGTRIVYVLRTTDRAADRDIRTLWTVPVAGGEPRQLTRGTADGSPAWSPDGTRIAFLRAQDGPAQLWLLPADGGEPEQLTTLPLGAGAPVWRPDGGALAFSTAVDLAATDGEDEAARTARGTAPVVSDRLGYKADGTGLLRTYRSHLHVLDLATKEVRQLSTGDWHASSVAWSPDGARLAFAAAQDVDADLSFRTPVHVLAADQPGAQPELAGLPTGVAGTVSWTADGAALLVTGRDDTSAGHQNLLRVDLGGDVHDLSAPLDRNVMAGLPGYPGGTPTLIDEGQTVLFCARDRGYTHLYAVGVDGGAPRLLIGGEQTVSGLSVSGDIAAVVLGTRSSYAEIAVLNLATGELAVRTGHSESAAELFLREEREFTISDGVVVHGWLLRDPDRTGPLPLLLDIHGGPHNAWNGAADPVHLYHQVLVAQGWAVLLLNPRASDGYGEAFYTAALGAWGVDDARDFLEPLDDLVAEGIADPRRLAVTGYSYGGFMTCYLTSRDPRFAAAVAGGVVSDLTSMAGTSDAAHYLTELELGSTAEVGPMSPLTKVGQVRTPTLILHGEADDRCPVGQAEQWFTALREQGVPTRLVRYPGGDHLFILNGKPSHRADFNQRVADWVRQYAVEPGRPRRAPIDAAHWQRRLSALCKEYGVPGAGLGILRLDGAAEVVQASHGVLSTATGVPVTDDSVFQIGSISKVWTATQVLRLVDEGNLDLDAPIADVLPELRLADPIAAGKVTMRHLLSHTSGIDGDVFTDTGRGDECLARYVDLLAEVKHNHPLGVTFSYCNSGFILAGRVIEKLTGLTWDAALREQLIEPLGLTHTGTLPEEALLYRAAVGHVGEGEAKPAPAWTLPRSCGPAGLIFASTADVLTFARMHLSGGLAADGTRVLSAESALAMTDKQTEVPDPHVLGDSWGLGWIRFGWDGHRLIGHDGNTIGQSAFLRVLPEAGIAVTLLTNGGQTRDLFLALYREIFAELAGITMPAPLEPAPEPPVVNAARHLGRYERAGQLIEVFEGDTGLRLRMTITGPMAELAPEPPREFDLTPITDSLFVCRMPGAKAWMSVTFYALPTGEPYVHLGVRATPKVS
ncbi:MULTISPECIES: serine hydrolase [unclassified Crossiella]|uniref:serine hydrolase n=1 Tax=unclassified Crossiella TaxID=2620835 RepID=UPI001FFFE026|nr:MULTISPECIES: serine hydrolase [unclassified Crossiella]MCK2239076.1 serine hydrolase [Crossiella sp. S99.2]MCK2251355.1 serine hydrolase [Crossiella sp. S99.1]